MQQNDLTKSLVEAFLYLAPQEGLYPTHISNITLMRVDHSTQPVAVLQEPSIVLVIQGALLHKPICKGFFSDIIFK